MGSGLWATFEQCEQKSRIGQWTLARCVEQGEQKTRNDSGLWAASVEQGEQKNRNGQWTLGS